MIEEYQIRILPEQAASEEGIKRYLAQEKGLDVRTLHQVRVLKRSIDARQRTIYVNLKVRAYINEYAQDEPFVRTEYPDVSSRLVLSWWEKDLAVFLLLCVSSSWASDL